MGTALLAVLVGLFAACGVFSQDPGPGPGASHSATLFFSVILAYIIPVFGYISERTVVALTALGPALEADDAELDSWRARICRKPVGWLVSVLLIGGTTGVMHNLLLFGPVGALVEQFRSSAVAAVIVGIEAVWIVVTLVVAALLDNALLLNRLARRARVQLFSTRQLRPFASVAVISTLALIGAQAAFPILFIEGEQSPLIYAPGLLATGIPMLLIAALPVWPVHRRIAAVKDHALRAVDRRIGALPLPDPDRPETLHQLTPLLSYRRELAQHSEWPFDVGVVSRLGLYLIIPPVTWVGAALIENVVEVLL
jgi:hypothetical protein